ncbi:class I SAM-dependent methyltransferase [Nitrospinae bacterium AH_259_B05_G02_I21]|nr:class I SAM-dependent methyltransferase [Nitrospinae bacterium AH_259_B05_G02_I21]MDA2932198.1 class I SAM-dependent methyltransferase [Nitrospinae bacterium AH-259-F20]
MDERWHDPSRDAIQGVLEEVANELAHGTRVLDAGAGEARYSSLFARANYVACDFAKGEPKWDYSRLSVVCDLAALAFQDGTFDLIISTEALEHIPDPQAVFKEFARALVNGGRLLVTVPFQGYREHQVPYDYYRYTRYGLEYLAGQAGLKVDEVRAIGGVFSLMAKLVHYLTGYWFLQPEPTWKRIAKKPLRVTYSIFKRIAFRILSALDRRDNRRDFPLHYFLICTKI